MLGISGAARVSSVVVSIMRMKQLQANKAFVSLALGCLTIGEILLGAGSNCSAAIIYPKAPDGGRQIVHENAARILREQPEFLGGLHIEDLAIGDPYGAYYVEPTSLVAGRLLSGARLGEWMYLFTHGTNAVGAEGLDADKKTGKALGFSGLYKSNVSYETLEALRIAEQLPRIKKQDYELRRLQISALSFVAVWLHRKSDDIILPLPPTFGRWNAYQPYSEKQMIKLLKPEAKKRLKQSGKTLG